MEEVDTLPLLEDDNGVTHFNPSSFLKFAKVDKMNGDEEDVSHGDTGAISIFSFSDLVLGSWNNRFHDRK